MANKLKFGNGEWYGKEGSILAYNDEGGNYKPLPFNFSRSSTARVINKEGLIKEVGLNQPRVDYKDNTKGAMLLEPTSTNYLQYSEDFSQSYWSKQGTSSITLNTTISPNGSLNADTLSGATGTGVSDSVLRVNVGLSEESTLSIYCKSLGSTNLTIYIRDGSNGSIGSESITLTDDWQRVVLTKDPNNGQVFFGNTNGDVAIWGVQLEQQSYATSYIPNYGTSAGVTRSQDIGGSTGDIGSFIGNEGVFELTTSLFDLNSEIILCDGTDNNRITFRNYASLPNKINISVKEDNSPVIGGDYTFDSSAKNKFQVFFGNGKVEIKINDALVDSENVNTSFSGKLDVIRLANASGTTNRFKGRINEIKIYNTL